MITKKILERREIDLMRTGEAIPITVGVETILLSADVPGWTHMNGNGKQQPKDGHKRYGSKTASILETISKNPGLKAKQIMDEVGLDGKVYWLLSKLKGKGLATRNKKTGGWSAVVNGEKK